MERTPYGSVVKFDDTAVKSIRHITPATFDEITPKTWGYALNYWACTVKSWRYHFGSRSISPTFEDIRATFEDMSSTVEHVPSKVDAVNSYPDENPQILRIYLENWGYVLNYWACAVKSWWQRLGSDAYPQLLRICRQHLMTYRQKLRVIILN